MDRITMENLRRLAMLETKPRVTLYMPTNPGNQRGTEDVVRLKNLADVAEEQLIQAGCRMPVVRELVEQLRFLHTRPDFWHNRSQGLVVFAADDTFLPLRLPTSFPESATVGPRFLLKPVLSYLLSDRQFLLLALSRNCVKLYRGSRETFEEISVPALPSNMAEALNIDSVDPGQQVRSIRRGYGGKEDAIFHGQGGKPDTHKEEFHRYVIAIQHALQPILCHEQIPLLLAGVDYELAIFRNSCTYLHIVRSHLSGNPDKLTQHELHEQAWRHLLSEGDLDKEQAIAQYRREVGNGTTSREVREIVLGAARGDLDLLFVASEQSAWGVFDARSESLCEHDQRQPMDDDLLDLAAVETHFSRGAVFVLPSHEIPDRNRIAAVYRKGRVPQPAHDVGSVEAVV